MLLRSLEDAWSVFDAVEGTLVGVGMTAYSRLLPASLTKRYAIVALRKTRDLTHLRKKAPVFCLEEELGHPVSEPFDSSKLLSHPLARRFVNQLPGPRVLFLYQNYKELENLAAKESWILLANRAELRLQIAHREFFLEMVSRLRLPKIPSVVLQIQELHSRSYSSLARALGGAFVIQLGNIIQGGGRGTFFARSQEEYHLIQDHLIRHTWRGTPLKTVLLRRLIPGIPLSVVACVTRDGVLFSAPQRQLIDLPFCMEIPENGIFCGHAWSTDPWAPWIGKAIRGQSEKIGQYLALAGYKGIFGIDFIVEREGQRVFPLEINPRLTGALPMLSNLYLNNGRIPMEIFHILEFLNFPYRIDLNELNESYGEPVQGSHLLCLMAQGARYRVDHGLKAGLYEWSRRGQGPSFVREASDYNEFDGEERFIVADGPPDTAEPVRSPSSVDPFRRLCRILFPDSIINDRDLISQKTLQTIQWVREMMVIQNPARPAKDSFRRSGDEPAIL